MKIKINKIKLFIFSLSISLLFCNFSFAKFENKKNILSSNDIKIYKKIFKIHKLPIKMFFVQPPFYLEINYRILQVVIVPKLMDSTFIPFPFLRSKSSIIAGLHTVLWGW